MMEEELKIKTEIIKKQERLIQGWREELKDQLDKHNVVFGEWFLSNKLVDSSNWRLTFLGASCSWHF